MRLTLKAFAALSLCASLASADATKTLRAELSTDPSRPFRVENLAGKMVVRAGSGPKVVVTVTAHGGDAATAALLSLREVRDERSGEPTLRVQYPLDEHKVFRYHGGRDEDSGFFARLFSGTSQVTYDGRRVSVSSSRGLPLYADVVIEIPRGAVGTFKNLVGDLQGSSVEGTLRFDSGSGAIALTKVSGNVTADSGSGDVTASDVRGAFKCDTGSGACQLTGFDGDRLSLDTGSGDVSVRNARAKLVKANTGSGSVSLDVDDGEEVSADTGSGDVSMELGGNRLVRVSADTGSGEVSVRLPSSMGFDLRADVGSGDVTSGFDDATPITERRRVVGYRRGDQRVKIKVDTGSGDVSVGPNRR